MPYPKVTHRVITTDTVNANEEFKGRITVVTYLDNGESFTEYAYCNGTFAKEDEAYEAAVFMKYRWQVPELIGGL